MIIVRSLFKFTRVKDDVHVAKKIRIMLTSPALYITVTWRASSRLHSADVASDSKNCACHACSHAHRRRRNNQVGNGIAVTVSVITD